MKKLSLFLFICVQAIAEDPAPELRKLYLKAMQEPTGKHFQLFQKACKKSSAEPLQFSDDTELLKTLKPKKRHLGSQVHLLVMCYKYCTNAPSKSILEDIFATETLDKNLKKFISSSCREQLSETELQQILSKPIPNIERLKKRLKAITIPGKCGEYKGMVEKLVNNSSF